MDENGTQTSTLYDGSDLIMDFNSSGSLEMRYLNGPTGQLVDTVLARESASGTVAWYLPDRLGTVRDLINNSGAIIDHIDFSAFGTVLDQSAPSEGDRMMGFEGMELDSVTGLNLAMYRAQDPGTGRWTSQDPLGFAGGDVDLYRYAGNSPAQFSDPSGLSLMLTPEQFLNQLSALTGIPVGTLLANPGFKQLWDAITSPGKDVKLDFMILDKAPVGPGASVLGTAGGMGAGAHWDWSRDYYGVLSGTLLFGKQGSCRENLRQAVHELLHAHMRLRGKLPGSSATDANRDPNLQKGGKYNKDWLAYLKAEGGLVPKKSPALSQELRQYLMQQYDTGGDYFGDMNPEARKYIDTLVDQLLPPDKPR
jgi:RHS repeat-associated protein